MTEQKTYWHLQDLKKKPSEYEIVTSRLLYYFERSFEVNAPVGEWYGRNQKGSAFQVTDWEHFKDPRETTYTKYTDLQKRKKIFVDGIFESMDENYEKSLAPGYLDFFRKFVAPLRYPFHGFQMVSSYIGSMAPAGRIVIAALLQSADEMRRIQRIAYRLRQHQVTFPDPDDSRGAWEKDASWQPLRKVVENLLVTFDWGEAFVALNLVCKPLFDQFLMTGLCRAAEEAKDDGLARIFASLEEDSVWHREWSSSLVQYVLNQNRNCETSLFA
ncbi:hypothetical protein L0156_26770 [bacterium]|nr:hypothetical protein [bacterium]